MNGISAGGSSAGMMQMQGMRQGQGAGGKFNQLDADGSGSIDQDELQVLADKVSLSGSDLNISEAAATYDANSDGLLDKDETQAMMKDLQGSMKGGQVGEASQKSLAAYLSNPTEDATSQLLEALTKQDDEQEGYKPFYAET